MTSLHVGGSYYGESIELVGFRKLPSGRALDKISSDRNWLLEHAELLAQLEPERNRDIVSLRFGVEDATVRAIGFVAREYGLDPQTIQDIVDYSLGDLKRIAAA